jgi:hypothetical protein
MEKVNKSKKGFHGRMWQDKRKVKREQARRRKWAVGKEDFI